MNPHAKITLFVLLGLLVLALGWDLLAASCWGWDATISRTVWYVIQQAPIIAFLIGLACGHLLWPQQADRHRGHN